MTVGLSVVLAVLDGERTVAVQLAAVQAQLTDGRELVVVDNGSTDRTADIVSAAMATDERVRLVRCSTRGLNRARNAGVRAASGRLVLFCDADDEVRPGWIDAMEGVLATCDLVGGAVDPVDEHGTPLPEASIRLPGEPVLWDLASPWGCSCGMRRDVWERVGGFDEDLPLGGEEIDFFLRAQLAGASLGWATDAPVRYWVKTDARHRREHAVTRNVAVSRAYWIGRMAGRPRRGGLLRDAVRLVVGAPGAAVSAERRALWVRVLDRRRSRALGAWRYAPAGIRERRSANAERAASQEHRADA